MNPASPLIRATITRLRKFPNLRLRKTDMDDDWAGLKNTPICEGGWILKLAEDGMGILHISWREGGSGYKENEPTKVTFGSAQKWLQAQIDHDKELGIQLQRFLAAKDEQLAEKDLFYLPYHEY